MKFEIKVKKSHLVDYIFKCDFLSLSDLCISDWPWETEIILSFLFLYYVIF